MACAYVTQSTNHAWLVGRSNCCGRVPTQTGSPVTDVAATYLDGAGVEQIGSEAMQAYHQSQSDTPAGVPTVLQAPAPLPSSQKVMLMQSGEVYGSTPSTSYT